MEKAHIIDAVAHHDKTVEADIDVKARPFLWVQAGCPQNVGVRHAAWHDLDPTYLLADTAALAPADLAAHVDLEAGLHEGEETGAHTRFDRVAKDFFKDGFNEQVSGGERKVLFHDEGLVLVEGALVAGVGAFVTVNHARVHKARGCAMLAQVMDACPGKVWP